MTPVESNYCYDESGDCPYYAETSCYKKDVKEKCKKSCGLCEGNILPKINLQFFNQNFPMKMFS